MSKMSELDLVLQELHAAAQAIIGACESVRAFYSQGDEPHVPDEPKEPPETKSTPLTLERVRGVLADKSRAGHTEAVRELLIKHGGSKLSEIDPNEYAALLAEAEVLGNG